MMFKLSEILELNLRSEMVVLSACNTGSGKVTSAEGVSSLGTAFLAAGSSSVAVSLWEVADKSTAMFMQDFYNNLLSGMSKDKALARARFPLSRKDIQIRSIGRHLCLLASDFLVRGRCSPH